LRLAGPLDDDGGRSRWRPFAVGGVVAWALLPVGGEVRWTQAIAAVLVAVLICMFGLRRGSRLPVELPLGLVVVGLGVLRDAAGGAQGGYGVLLLMPVLWVALYGNRRALFGTLVATGLTLVAPLLLIGGTHYPESGWRGAPMLLFTCAAIGVIVQGLLSRERAAAAQRARLLSVIGDGVIITAADGLVLEVNESLCRMTGYAPEQIVGTRPPYVWCPEEEYASMTAAHKAAIRAGGGELQARLLTRDGHELFVLIALAVDCPGGGRAATVIATVKDVSEQVRVQQRLQDLALTDRLTGLPNRRALDTILPLAIAEAERSALPLSVAMIDLDHFKRYNDTHGHAAGDRLLADLARDWSALLRPTDTLARLGGEEFCLVLPGCHVGVATSLLHRLQAATPHGQSFSAGLAAYTLTATPGELLEESDRMLYAAKRAGRARIHTVHTAAGSR
jgi:diguanylate cyclase (GGDEF)-like protein/PAS domain S-box-containing protein